MIRLTRKFKCLQSMHEKRGSKHSPMHMIFRTLKKIFRSELPHLAAVHQLLGQLHAAARQVRKHLRVHSLLPGPVYCSPESSS